MPICIGSFCLGGDPETTTTSPRATHTSARDTDPATTTQPFFSSVISRLLPTFDTTSTTPSATSTSAALPTSSVISSSSSAPSFLPTIVTSTSTSLPSISPTVSDANASASASSTNANGGGSSNTGAIVGAAFGAIVGAIILAVVVGKFLSWRRQQKEAREEREASNYDPWVGGGAAAAAGAGGRRLSRSSSGAGRALERRPAHQSNASTGSWHQFQQQQTPTHEPEMSLAYPQQTYGQQWAAPQAGYGRGAWPGAPAPPPAPSSPYMTAMSNPIAPYPQARSPYETLPIGAQPPVAYHQENPYARNVTSPEQMRQRRMSRGANDAYGGMD